MKTSEFVLKFALCMAAIAAVAIAQKWGLVR